MLKKIRFLYPHADATKDLAVHVNVIDKAFYKITFYAVYFHDPGRFFGSGIGCLSCLIRAHRKIPLQRTSHRDFSAAVQFR